ncbi:CPBP family intramembrane metalloprotease [Clostridium sp. SHJSY1]|uniref:CPBP family intramembrane glutamic endopeptidase n=1 Tax=Clostridium sp. SHJSY1 TaxID=2942483 RepID=UPI00287673AE|nr:CPBP family intramembrane glutamic endopeptidase [Clostridium sp. SHJSY1]MDS0526339.1 CPBP family intramembrane metalloprotease [Clostridium sp. SHJSY1]
MEIYFKNLILGIFLYLIVFNIPVFIYIYKVDRINPLKYLKLTENPFKGILVGFIVSIMLVILLVLKNIVNGTNYVNFNIGILWLSGTMVGFLEEIPVRGFLFQKLECKMNFWLANILTTIIFVSLHIPTWINSSTNIIQSSITTTMVSLVFGYLFKEYKSLWTTIICHSVFNLCIWIGL